MVVRSGHCGPGNGIGIATGYGLDGPGIESRWGARFSAPVQTGPGAHTAFCAMGTGSFPGVKSGRGVTLAPHPLLVSWSWKCRAIPLLPLWAVQPVENISACTRGPLYDVVIGHRVVLSILVTHHFHCGLWQPVLRTCRYWEFFLLSLLTFVFILIAASVI